MSKHKQPEVVVVTGASAGVGRATVRKFAREGARIGLLARGLERLEDTRAEVEELGGEALVLPTDVADPDEVEQAAERVEAEFGPIDIWINNAMVTVMSPIKDTKPEEFRRVTEVTYLGVVHGTLSALRRMLPRDRGKIVQVGSALAYRGIPLQAPYCAAKHAVQGFTESLRSELLHDESKVELTIVHLPALNTPQFQWSKARVSKHPQPVPPIYEPEVAGDAVHWAAHHERREVWVGAPTVATVVGSRFASRYQDVYLARHGFEDQVTDELDFDPQRPDNLWLPVEGHQAARGPFSEDSHGFSPQFWANKHRGALAAAAGVGLALLGGYFLTQT